ncbi:ATP-dependent zinc metalloprotease FtsH [Phocaeicola coprocola]|uniref:ATP-dependent zinc metalloprotease FtsH n=1 Tax=Phocaeicola coprocola TaxID=310298 RepID=UPI001C3931E0|nr:ATP-dependent zinc metalloprotease FtsH [Phocaeicola coprocola]MBV3867149.1 ATP-dependent zinc metalloprotease FtsH [Phocaeicola coprocola]MBV4007662.1 ATP-dependent zinc metalloprotease FtsH [Phocaeicola coprocola]MBV4032753.1 ATP-dependent zinc metalloprotease FtsH [Phocaeicola coprocola]MBV4039336.1 ATP-dependent zinc metalloprotease FtsH [Phocaeicola coprocola]MBV4061009.1 ATP-dependent zinc metalloprotease FtsH [Phocaeicola coprocola]
MKQDVQNQQTKRGNPYVGFLWVILIVLLLNGLIFPKLSKQKIISTDYGSFIEKVNSGRVKDVMIKSSQIFFTAVDKNGETNTFQTGETNDPQLVERLLDADSPNENGKIAFNQIVPEENSPILNFLLMWILPGLIFYIIWRQTSKTIQSRMGAGGNFMSFGNSGAKIYADADIKTTFADVAGQEEAKETLKEIVDFLHNPKKYTEIGASLPKGALLVGPPGTGKTLIARAVAGEAKVPFFAISGSEFVQMFVGMGAAKVRDLFKQAGEKAPCIIFIDEIDAIGKKREGTFSGNDEREQTLNQLLTEMDGFDGRKGVVILAATNRPESLDKALLRPGRFDRRIQMDLPDLEGRKAILNVHLKKVKHDSINLDIVARATSGSSGAELANIVNEAALRAVRMGRTRVTTSDLEESVETVIAGAQRKGKVISADEKKVIAYHEIGHALVAAMQTHSAPVHKITIIPRTSGALGYTMQVDSGEQVLQSKEDLFNRIVTLTGGRAAEEIVCNTVTTGASNDIEQATKLARAMVTRFGMSDKYDMMGLETVNNAYLGNDTSLACSSDTAADIDREVLSLIKNAHDKAKSIISENMKVMHEAASFLIEKETITGKEFMDIVHCCTAKTDLNN